MHLYPYHSPVRFYPNQDSLQDETNSQNLQFFGGKNPYPLEVNEYHRFLIPSFENEINTTELELWLIGNDEVQIACEFGFNTDLTRLLRVSFFCDKIISGSFQIRKSSGETVFYSNCVKFFDSTMYDGRKYVRVATRCYFNKLGYQFDNSDYDWFVTNLPAYDLGLYMIESEYNTMRTGDMQSLEIQDSFIDEVSTLEFIGMGDCNVINFILFSVLNNEFYINGTQRTIKEKPEVDVLMMIGKMKFTFNKDKFGKYIPVNEGQIFSDVFRQAIGNGDKTLIYVHDTNYIIPT